MARLRCLAVFLIAGGLLCAPSLITQAKAAPSWQIGTYSGSYPNALQRVFQDTQDVGIFSMGTTGLNPNSVYDRMYTVNDVVTWIDGMTIPPEALGFDGWVSTDGSGSFYHPDNWPAAATVPGAYDVIFDANANGVYNAATDPICSDWVGTAGFVVISPSRILFNEGFEGQFPSSNWAVGDANPNNGLDFWDDTAVRSHSGSWSAWCADEGTHYVNTTIWSESFEGSFPTTDYQIVDVNAGSGEDMWDDTNYRAHGGVWSAWCAQIGTQLIGVDFVANFGVHRYDDNMKTYLVRWTDLSSYSFARLSYWYWIDSEPTYDKFYVMYQKSNQSGGIALIAGDIISGNSNGWKHAEVTIPSDAVWVGFVFESDSSTKNYEGAYVDDIVLTGSIETPNYANSQYDDNMEAFMNRTIDMSAYASATLSFWLWLNCEPGVTTHDWFEFNLYKTDRTSSISRSSSYNSGGWEYREETILAGSDVVVEFYFHSDSATHSYEGAYLDDIMLVGIYPPPTGSILINGGNAYASSTAATLSLTYEAHGPSVSQVRYSNDDRWDTEPWETPAASKAWSLTPGEGTKTVYFQVKDSDGILSSTYSDSITLSLDTTPPTGSIQINEGIPDTGSTGVTLSLTYADTGSGVSQVRYSNDGVSWTAWEPPAPSKDWSLSAVDGVKTVYFQVKDSVELVSSTYSDTIILDTSPPQGSIQINNGADYTNTTQVTLTLLATDAGTGVWGMRFSNDAATWTTWEPYKTTKTWSLESSPGEKRVNVQFIDNVDLTVWAYEIITIDTTLPVANAGQNQNTQIGQAVTFNGAASTDNTGIASYLWNFGDGTTGTGPAPTHTYTATGNYTVSLMVQDLAGNSAATTATVKVEVIIPEFPSATILMVFVILASVLAAKFKERRRLLEHAR